MPPDCQEWVSAINGLFSPSPKLMMGPSHETAKTKAYKEMKESWRRIYELAMKRVRERMEEITEEDRRAAAEASGEEEAPARVDFLTYLMHSGKMTVGEVATNSIDMLTAGVDTVSISGK